jgi:hypothetical protein
MIITKASTAAEASTFARGYGGQDGGQAKIRTRHKNGGQELEKLLATLVRRFCGGDTHRQPPAVA